MGSGAAALGRTWTWQEVRTGTRMRSTARGALGRVEILPLRSCTTQIPLPAPVQAVPRRVVRRPHARLRGADLEGRARGHTGAGGGRG